MHEVIGENQLAFLVFFRTRGFTGLALIYVITIIRKPIQLEMTFEGISF